MRKTNRPRRHGAAVVELAVCLPLFMLLVFATIEVADMMYLKQSVYTTAYEGARVAIRPGAKTADVNTRCSEILAARGVRGATIRFEPANIDGQARGSTVAVVVSAPSGGNSRMPAWFLGGQLLRARTVMVRE